MPIEKDAFYSMLGIARRAGVLTLGTDAVTAAIAAGQAGMVLLDSGASRATREKYHSVCKNAGVVLIETPEGLLHEATGRPGVAMAVHKGGLAEQIKRVLPAKESDQPMKSANKCGGASVE